MLVAQDLLLLTDDGELMLELGDVDVCIVE